jgi:hypothetical protein
VNHSDSINLGARRLHSAARPTDLHFSTDKG